MTVAVRPIHAALNAVMSGDRGRLLAALIARLGDFQMAEDALHDAVLAALDAWGGGVPDNPPAWLYRVAERKALDRLRRVQSFGRKADELAALLPDAAADRGEEELPDHRLKLIFTCCHPALDPKSRVALTLRTIGGLTTEEIARAFLAKTPTMAQRLVRAKAKIAKAGIPYAVPEGAELAPRVASVLSVIYLIFNEGYAATSGDSQMRRDLCGEAIYLARLMAGFRPEMPEAAGLLALMLLSHARLAAREGKGGAYVPLDAQDRERWDSEIIAEGQSILADALRRGQAGPYQLQAAIAALHCEAPRAEDTDWPQIVALYRLLVEMGEGAVAALNFAVASAHVVGAERALASVEALAGELAGYQPFHSARADLLRRLDRRTEAAAAYEAALALTNVASEGQFLISRRDLCLRHV